MEKDETFHRKRIMFCITLPGNVIHIADGNDPRSHIEWFKDERWLGEKPEVFLISTTRGFYYPTTNCLYAYFGRNFTFDKDTIQTIWINIYKLRELLNLNDETQIIFGPKDQNFNGHSYRQLFLGRLTDFIGHVYDQLN